MCLHNGLWMLFQWNTGGRLKCLTPLSYAFWYYQKNEINCWHETLKLSKTGDHLMQRRELLTQSCGNSWTSINPSNSSAAFVSPETQYWFYQELSLTCSQYLWTKSTDFPFQEKFYRSLKRFWLEKRRIISSNQIVCPARAAVKYSWLPC